MPQIQRGTLTSVLGGADEGIRDAVRGVVRLSGGSVDAFVKVLDAREVLVECICALLARLRGLNVPEPLLVLVPGAFRSDGADRIAFGSVGVAHGNLRPWLANIGDAAVLRRLRAWVGLVPAACFDEWIANPDRHAGNILFDGKDEFWLIDHGLALATGVAPNQAVKNILFNAAVDGLGEADCLLLKSKALGVVDSLVEQTLAPVIADVPTEVLSRAAAEEIGTWLDARKAHLLRLTDARIQTKQGDLLTGGRDGV